MNRRETMARIGPGDGDKDGVSSRVIMEEIQANHLPCMQDILMLGENKKMREGYCNLADLNVIRDEWHDVQRKIKEHEGKINLNS